MMKKAIQTVPAKDVDEYLSPVPKEARDVLQKLRRTIQAAAPKAVEKISYRMPTFNYLGPLVGFAAFRNHCSFFVMSYKVMALFKEDLKPYDTATATIHFPVNKPLPVSLVTKLVKARIEENEARHKKAK
jgi:uncharacterized protein YdhG (YjbR/CyaY superfamily)